MREWTSMPSARTWPGRGFRAPQSSVPKSRSVRAASAGARAALAGGPKASAVPKGGGAPGERGRAAGAGLRPEILRGTPP